MYTSSLLSKKNKEFLATTDRSVGHSYLFCFLYSICSWLNRYLLLQSKAVAVHVEKDLGYGLRAQRSFRHGEHVTYFALLMKDGVPGT